MVIHTASICAGGGGLDLGIRLALPEVECVLYVENGITSAAVLAARIEGGYLDPAPIWSDLRTLTGAVVSRYVDRIDLLYGGFPCQPHSVAGQQRGADDERDLWPAVARIIGELKPRAVFLENVPGIIQYYFNRIRPELRTLGYTATEGIFSAAETGASHNRERLFILGALDNAGCRSELGWRGFWNGFEATGTRVAHSRRRTQHPEQQEFGPEREGEAATGTVGSTVGHTGHTEADTEGFRQDGSQAESTRGRAGLANLCLQIFPPGPADTDTWTRVLSGVSAVEPTVCRVADGLASGVDRPSHRGDRLAILGNGVVPTTAALAFTKLWGELNDAEQ